MGLWGTIVDFVLGSDYVHAAVILAFALILARLILFFFKYVVERQARKTPSRLDDKIVLRIEHPIIIVIILVGIQLAARKILTASALIENLIKMIGKYNLL